MTDTTSSGEVVLQNSRAHFEPLGFSDAAGDAVTGTPGADTLQGDPGSGPGAGLPGAVAFWRFDDGIDGSFADSRGGAEASVYRLVDRTAVSQTDPATRPGPNGSPNSALEFNGDDTFAFIAHDPAMEVTQGTVSVWVQPDELSKDQQIILSKDECETGDGGHFRLGHQADGRIFIRFAEGDGGSNKAWVSSSAYLSEGEWTHLAVSFTEDGITVHADGVAIPDYAWYRKEGNLDSPAQASEAYILQNDEPWLLGVDTSGTKVNDDPDAFAADTERLDDAFDGAIADFGLWGGFTPDAALDAAQVHQLFTEGPGTALTAASGAQPILAGDDVIEGLGGNDSLSGGGGNDELLGGAGSDSLKGGYGDDILDGGADDDVLEGGRGSDLLLGGDGDDLLVSRSDSGEQRIGQLAIGEPTRGDPDNEVNPERQKLYGWEDQPLVGDDVMVGGAGRDTFLFNPQINAKRDIILEHVNDDRTIDWAAVAGENNELHDHWVDSFGIDIIADYRADEDTIAIVGHTATPEVEHKWIDTDGDGVNDEAVSVITVYSNQGGGGGAHTEDLLGQIVVHGDLVDADDIVREAGVTHGIVETVDEIQEALAPSGELKTSELSDGSTVIGYDTRDAEGNLGEVMEDPERFSDNPFLDSGRFEFAGNVPDDVPVAVAVIDELSHPALDAMVFTGNGDDGESTGGVPGAYVNIAHEGRASGLAQTAGTIAFSFVADNPGAGKQVLFSKDAGGYVDGGHLTAWIDDHGCLDVRYQSTDKSLYFKADGVEHLEAGVEYHFAFSFDAERASLYLNGELEASKDLTDYPSFAAGMSGNTESLVFGASTMYRTSGEVNNLNSFFDGSIDDVVVIDRELYGVEAFQLANGVLSIVSTAGDEPPVDDTPDEPPVDDTPDEPPVDDTPDEPPVDDTPDEPPVDDTPDEPPVDDTPDEPPVDDDVVLKGTRGNDELEGGSGNDFINGKHGDDLLIGNGGADAIKGGAGADTIEAGDGDDTVKAGLGDDVVAGGAGNDVLLGGRGNDALNGGEGNDTISAGHGDDTVNGGEGADVIKGGRGDDVIDGGSGNNRITGGRGSDVISTAGGDDEINGGHDDDHIDGGAGNNLIAGGRGNDVISADGGNDVIDGGRGDDLIGAGAGDNQIAGGRGDDVIRAAAGNDEISGGSGDDEIDAGAGDDVISGGRGDDRVVAGDGADVIMGGRGDDILRGGGGADLIEGERGDDILIGGAGDDDMSGGRGNDVFVFEAVEGGHLGFDVVRDFRSGKDALLISGDLTLLFDDAAGHTKITLKDGADAVVGTIDVLGNSFDADTDITKIAGPDTSGDLFA